MTEIEARTNEVHSEQEEDTTLSVDEPKVEWPSEADYEIEMVEREVKAIGDTKDAELMLYYAKRRYGLTDKECASLRSVLEAALNSKKDYGIDGKMLAAGSETMGDFFEKYIAKVLQLKQLNKGFTSDSRTQLKNFSEGEITDDEVTGALDELKEN